MIRKIIFILALAIPAVAVAEPATKIKTTNSEEGKVLFQKVYNLIFGAQGSKFVYEVNIASLYKTKGFVAYHGKKQYYDDSHATVWEDGINSYQYSKRDKVIRIFSCSDPDHNKWMSKFKFEADKFTYSYKTVGEYYEITAKLKKHSLFGLRELVGKVYRKNLYPVSLTAKLPLIQAVVKLTNFHSGVTDDDIFVFPKERFKNLPVEDKR